MKLKTRKSVAKRFKITRNGKVLRKATGLDHSRSKKTGKKIRDSRKWISLSKPEARRIRKIIAK